MDAGQTQFYNFLMERVAEGKEDQAKQLLEQCFVMQAAGTFTKDELQRVVPQLMGLIKPDKLGDLRTAMQNFKPQK